MAITFANIEAVKILNNKDFFDDVLAKTTLIGLVISIKHLKWCNFFNIILCKQNISQMMGPFIYFPKLY